MFKPISTALCAYGMSGKVFHGPLLSAHPDFDLSAVWERSNKRLQDDYPAVSSHDGYHEILEDEAIDLVIVNTPEASHYELASEALRAGKHVVVEKAFVVRSEEGEKLISLAQEQGKVLSVFHNRRWDSDFLTIQDLIRSGRLGRLIQYEAHYDRFRPQLKKGHWREEGAPGSSSLYNLGSHLIDQTLQLFGLPIRVMADIRKERNGSRVDDAFSLWLEYDKGLKATLKSSYLVREPVPRYQIHGEKGSFLKSGLDPQEHALVLGQIPGGNYWGKEPRQDWGLLHEEKPQGSFKGKIPSLPGSYLSFYDGLAAAIHQGDNPPVTAHQANQVIRLIEVAYESAAKGKWQNFY